MYTSRRTHIICYNVYLNKDPYNICYNVYTSIRTHIIYAKCIPQQRLIYSICYNVYLNKDPYSICFNVYLNKDTYNICINHFCLETPKSVIGKQCRSKSDVKCFIWSWFPLFANSLAIFLYGYLNNIIWHTWNWYWTLPICSMGEFIQP